jgi:hypothetical protein
METLFNTILTLLIAKKNNTKNLEGSFIKITNINSSNKTVNFLLSYQNFSNQSKLSLSSLNELTSSFAAAAAADAFDNTTVSVFLHILILVLYSILIFISLTSNPLLIYVLLIKRKTQLKLIDVFVINLSISDFFLTIFNIPLCLTIFFSGKWLFGTLICKLGTYSTSSAIYINILTMAYISVDRYFAVTGPLISNRSTNLRINTYNFDYATKRKMYIALAVIWFVAFVISIPQFIFTKIAKIDGKLENDEKFFAAAAAEELFDSNNKFNLDTFNFDYYMTPSVTDDDSNNGKSDVHFSKFGEGLMNRCTMEYPLINMKFYMVILNFSLQYLLPSLVILFFYGKIIYHLYLNLNIEVLFSSSSDTHHHNNNQHQQQQHTINNSNDSIQQTDIDITSMATTTTTTATSRYKKRGCCFSSLCCANNNNSAAATTTTTTSIHKCENHSVNHTPEDIPLRPRSKGSLMRVEGINRANNLKKSMKIMIIIITSFLISWLPIHLYRLVTTFHPFFTNKISQSENTLNLFVNEIQLNIKNCTIENFIQCLYLNEDLTSKTSSSRGEFNNNYTTIHNRYLFFFFHFLSMSSVCYNPIVYFWLHKKFRKEVNSMLRKIFSITTFIRNNTINKIRRSTATTTTTTTNNSAILKTSSIKMKCISNNGAINGKATSCNRVKKLNSNSKFKKHVICKIV